MVRDRTTEPRVALDTSSHSGSSLVEVPEDLREASPLQLLHLALVGDSGSDTLESGLHAAIADLEVLRLSLTPLDPQNGDDTAANALHQVQARLRVLAELRRRTLEMATKEQASGGQA